MLTPRRSRPAAGARRVHVRKAAEVSTEAWLKAGLPRGHGLAPAREMARQIVALQDRLLVLLQEQQERYARYVEEHQPALAPIAKDAAQDLPPEALGTFHSWLEGVALRREWWREPTLSFELDQAQLSDALREALEEAVGTGGEAARRALGALGPGFASLGQTEARALLTEIAAYTSSASPEAQAIYQAVADRAAGRAMRAAVLRDGAGRLVGAISYRSAGGALDVVHLGALDGSVPGTGVQLLRELAAIAAKEGKDIVLQAPAEAQSFFSSLGFAADAEGGLRLSIRAASELAQGIPAGAPGWVRVGWLEGPQASLAVVDEAMATELLEQVMVWSGQGGNRVGLAVEALGGAGGDLFTTIALEDRSGKLLGVAYYHVTEEGPVMVDALAAAPDAPPGTGRRLMREIASVAARENRAVALQTLDESRSFYERLGMRMQPDGFMLLEAEEATAFASGLTGSTAFRGQLSWELAVAGASDWLREHKIPGVVDEVSTTTHQALVEALANGLARGESTHELALRVRHLDKVFGPIRAERIARTEVITANRHGGYQMGRDAGCTEHEWRSRVESPRTRNWHRSAHRQRVPYLQPYTVLNRKKEPEQLLYPGDTSLGAGPDNVIQCRCSERRVKSGVTDDSVLPIDEHGLATGPAAPGPVMAGPTGY